MVEGVPSAHRLLTHALTTDGFRAQHAACLYGVELGHSTRQFIERNRLTAVLAP